MVEWMIRLGARWDAFFDRRHGIQAIPGTKGLLRYQQRTYAGAAFELADGTEIKPGDQVIELHLGSAQLLRLGVGTETRRRDFQVLKVMKNALQALALETYPDGRFGNIKGCYAITLLLPGARRLGFVVREHTDRAYWREGWAMYLLECWYHLACGLPLRKAGRRKAQEIWISAKELQRRYNPDGKEA